MPESKDNKGKYLLFESSKELLAFDTDYITELSGSKHIHRLPHKANTCILGISNISGYICLILSLSKLLNIDDEDIFNEEKSNTKKLIICKNANNKLAFLVDDIHHLSDSEDTLIQEDEEFSAISSLSVFKVASIISKGKAYTILDIELLINALERNYL